MCTYVHTCSNTHLCCTHITQSFVKLSFGSEPDAFILAHLDIFATVVIRFVAMLPLSSRSWNIVLLLMYVAVLRGYSVCLFSCCFSFSHCSQSRCYSLDVMKEKKEKCNCLDMFQRSSLWQTVRQKKRHKGKENNINVKGQFSIRALVTTGSITDSVDMSVADNMITMITVLFLFVCLFMM